MADSDAKEEGLKIIVGLGVAVIAATGGFGIVNHIRAKRRKKTAKSRYDKRRAAYEVAERAYKQRHKEINEILSVFGKLKLEATVTLGQAAEFIGKAKVKDRDFRDSLELAPERLSEWKGASLKVPELLGGVVNSTLSGVGTASTVYGLVGLFGTASTGTDIDTLTGIARENATLAWLGGGAKSAGGGGTTMGTVMLIGMIAAVALLVSSFYSSAEAAEVESEVEMHVAKMDCVEAEMGKRLAYFDVMLTRIEELRESILKIESTLRQLFEEADAASEEDVYRVAKTAKSLADLLDTPVVEERPDVKPTAESELSHRLTPNIFGNWKYSTDV